MNYLTKLAAAALVATSFSASAFAELKPYKLDPSHSQVSFSYTHLGLSTTFGMFSGFEGEILFDKDNPAASSVSVSIPTQAMNTGWDRRDKHLQSGDFLGTKEGDVVTFKSTSIKITGDDTAIITGDLTVNGTTASVDLDTKMNFAGPHPSPRAGGVPTLGFTAKAGILRSSFDAGRAAPFVSDELALIISIEATGEK